MGEWDDLLHGLPSLRALKRCLVYGKSTEEQGGLVEAGHLEGNADLVAVMKVLVEEEKERVRQGQSGHLPMRADHGHLVAGDPLAGLPGHSPIGRLRGLAEMRGIQAALTNKDRQA